MAKDAKFETAMETVFEEQEEPDVELVDEGNREEEEENPEEITLKRADLEKLKSDASQAEALKEGISGGFREVLQRQEESRQPINQAPVERAQMPGESGEDFRKRFNEKLFGDDPYGLIQEMIAKTVGPHVAQVYGNTATQSKRILELDPEKGPTFKKFRKDIEAVVGSLPIEQQRNPEVWDYAYKQVLMNNIDALVDEKVNQRMAEAGEQSKKVSGPKPTFTEGTSSAPAPKKKRVYYTKQDVEEAAGSMMPLEQYLRTKGRMK